jgi:hypothetical protein
MSQQNGGTSDGRQPWDQESSSATPHVFPFGDPAQGGQGAPQAPAPQAPNPQGSQPQQWPQGSQPQPWEQQDAAGQQGSAPQQWGQDQWGQPQVDQPQGSQPHGAQPQTWNQPQQWGQPEDQQQWAPQQGQIPEYGDPAPSYGSQPQSYGEQPQPSGEQPQYGQQPVPDQGAQWAQPTFGSGPQHAQEQFGQQSGGHDTGSQGQTAGGPPQQWGDPSQAPVGQEQGSQGSPQFSGILDPHTGEIHPVPDLQNLDETDALLVVVSGPDAGAQILLDTDVVTVGRSPNADIFLDDVTVSRKHAEFVRTPSGFTLRDTGSLNGTYVGRQLIDSIELQNGADVQIGKFRMIFEQRHRTG